MNISWDSGIVDILKKWVVDTGVGTTRLSYDQIGELVRDGMRMRKSAIIVQHTTTNEMFKIDGMSQVHQLMLNVKYIYFLG